MHTALSSPDLEADEKTRALRQFVERIHVEMDGDKTVFRVMLRGVSCVGDGTVEVVKSVKLVKQPSAIELNGARSEAKTRVPDKDSNVFILKCTKA